jgi:hypothetical protein
MTLSTMQSIVSLSVSFSQSFVLSVTYKPIRLSVVMMNVVILSGIMLRVAAP